MLKNLCYNVFKVMVLNAIYTEQNKHEELL